MTLEANKALARTWFDEVINGRNLAAIDRVYSEDYIYRGLDGSLVGGRDEAKQIAEALVAAVPDRVATVITQLAEDDLVTTRWMSRGMQTGSLMGRPPTGAPVLVHGITISRIKDGRIVEDWEIVHMADQ
jgi:predicted ester cyclase